MSSRDREAQRVRGCQRLAATVLVMLGTMAAGARAQTDCAEGNGILDMTPPKGMTAQELIQKFTAEETKVKEARMHYTYTQDVMVQTLDGQESRRAVSRDRDRVVRQQGEAHRESDFRRAVHSARD